MLSDYTQGAADALTMKTPIPNTEEITWAYYKGFRDQVFHMIEHDTRVTNGLRSWPSH